MKKIKSLIFLLIFLVVIAVSIYFFLSHFKKQEVQKENISESEKLLNQINSFNVNQLDDVIKKVESFKKYGSIPVQEGQGRKKNPFVPF